MDVSPRPRFPPHPEVRATRTRGPQRTGGVLSWDRHQEGPCRVGGGEASALSPHTPRDLAARDGAYGAAATAALAGFVALLYLNKDTKKPAGEVTGVEARKEVPPHVLQELKDEEDLKVNFVGKDGKVNWREYVEYLDNRRYRGGKHHHHATEAVSGKEAMDEVTGRDDAVEPEDLEVDEEAMRARFEDWVKEYGRSYRSKKEKARRYEIFRKRQIDNDRRNKRNASKPNGARFGTSEFSDWTKEEWNSRMSGRCGAFDWEEYFAP